MSDNSSGSVNWSEEEVERLLLLIESGSSMRHLSRILERSESDLEKEAQFLSVHIPQREERPIPNRTTDVSATSVIPRYTPFLQGTRRVEA